MAVKELLQYFVAIFGFHILHVSSSQDCKPLNGVNSGDLSVIYSEHSGGLANQLLMYAMLRQLRQEFYLNAYMSRHCYETLAQIFTEKSIQDVPVFEDTFCKSPSTSPFEAYVGPMVNILTDTELHHGRFIWLFPSDKVLNRNENTERPYKVYSQDEHTSSEHTKFVERYDDAMRRLLKFKPEIQDRVDDTLSQIAGKMDLDVKEVLFIGVHNNRYQIHKTKQPGKSTKKGSALKPYKRSYFQDAMESMTEDYETNVAFLYVSDDMKWGTKNLEDGDNYDLYFVGDGDPQNLLSVGHDLAIFSRCNHTIISKGMMSRWAAILSGGEYYTEYGPVVPDRVNENIPKPEDYEDMTDLLRDGDSLEQYMPMHFKDGDFENEYKLFWWDDIISYIKFDLYFWITSFLPF